MRAPSRRRSRSGNLSLTPLRDTIKGQMATSLADGVDEIISEKGDNHGQALFLDFGDATNAICRHCGHPFGSWSVIEKGFCPECHAVITEEEKKNSWCVMCGGALRPDERGWASVGIVLLETEHDDEREYTRRLRPSRQWSERTSPIFSSPAFVFNISSHRFIFTEVESNCRSFLLKLAEAFPGDPPIIQLQTEAQISKQVREFCENRDAA